MNYLEAKKVAEQLRQECPAGTRVELVRMDDKQAPPVGTRGTVYGIDDTASLLVHWDNGSGLSVIYGVDVVKKVPVMDEKVKEQIFAIRDTGLANMLDLPYVQRLAFDRNYYELVNYIEENKKDYWNFIMTGKTEDK